MKPVSISNNDLIIDAIPVYTLYVGDINCADIYIYIHTRKTLEVVCSARGEGNTVVSGWLLFEETEAAIDLITTMSH